jgi:hypothetical protein
MFDCRVCEEDYAERAHVLLQLLEFRGIERVVPADVYEDFDAAIEFEEGL